MILSRSTKLSSANLLSATNAVQEVRRVWGEQVGWISASLKELGQTEKIAEVF